MSAVTVNDVTMEFRLIRERQRTLKESVVKLLKTLPIFMPGKVLASARS